MSDCDRSNYVPADRDRVRDPKWVGVHRGDTASFLHRHHRQAAKYLKRGRAGVSKLAKELVYRISDEKNLWIALDHLKWYGGRTPGPDGETFESLTPSRSWNRCRALRDWIREGGYEPGEETTIEIPKGSGRGKRYITLQSIEDRVVQRGAVQVLQPLLDPLFDERSFGFRPDMCRLDALAAAEQLVVKERRGFAIAEDIRDAFNNVPIPRLLDIVASYLPDADLHSFIERILSNATMDGLRQGGSLSPLLLNLYLHHLLDRPWRKKHASIPLLRYADDLLLLCRNAKEAVSAYDSLAQLLRPTKMHLKLGLDQSIFDLYDEDEPLEWLGFQIVVKRRRFDCSLAPSAWERFEYEIARAAAKRSPLEILDSIVLGWISQAGPAYRRERIDNDCERVFLAIEKTPIANRYSVDRLAKYWRAARARWQSIRVKHGAASTY